MSPEVFWDMNADLVAEEMQNELDKEFVENIMKTFMILEPDFAMGKTPQRIFPPKRSRISVMVENALRTEFVAMTS